MTHGKNMTASQINSLLEIDAFAKKWFDKKLMYGRRVLKLFFRSLATSVKEPCDENRIQFETSRGLIRKYGKTFGGLAGESAIFAFRRILQRLGLIGPPINYDYGEKEIEAVLNSEG